MRTRTVVRDKRFEIRFSEKEIEFLRKIAKKNGQQVSEYIRTLLFVQNDLYR